MNRSTTQKAVLAIVLGAVTITTAACNTVKGVGRDIESVGQAGEDVIKGN
ncbi:entericidin A/B family lipoprotein [Erythrobacter sp. SCSIO 43205]|nr:entericidin A/B family lipoprotein [Erythrobacter sp. SCSIO 43205]UAB79447.1 entericidin A/B family lipoprotein [Erythrobacter sp. SCSIO 43205]